MGYSANGSIRTTGTVAGDGVGQVTKIKAGTGIQLESAGTQVSIIASGGGSGGGNTLDGAYDQGGAGVGRSITADNGAVQITGSADPLLHLAPGSNTANAHIFIETDGHRSFRIENEDGSDLIKTAGAIHTSFQADRDHGVGEKATEHTAMDL